MILYIDTENETVFLYEGKKAVEIPFSEISTLNEYTKGRAVYYINQIVETSTEDVINLVASIAGTNLQSYWQTKALRHSKRPLKQNENNIQPL